MCQLLGVPCLFGQIDEDRITKKKKINNREINTLTHHLQKYAEQKYINESGSGTKG